jgi:dCTP deaminase
MIAAGAIRARSAILPEQIQPSSLDLRLGAEAHRVRASFLAHGGATITSKLDQYRLHTLDLTRPAVLEKGCVYIIPLQEELALPEVISGKANPKSSTGRLDIFTRLITDEGRQFEIVPSGYKGRLYAEVVPRTFSVVVRQGERLSQLRLFQGEQTPSDMLLRQLEREEALVYLPDESRGEPSIQNGLRLSVDLAGDESPIIGYRAKRHAPLIDLAKIQHYDPADFWDPIARNESRTLILDPEDFYILASREKVRIPANYAAEMVPFDPTIGEFRIHYAGFFDPGFGYGSGEINGTRAVLEVRSHEVPFILEDGQVVASLVFERLLERPRLLYGEGIGSSYQRQGLKLSKHFRTPPAHG